MTSKEKKQKSAAKQWCKASRWNPSSGCPSGKTKKVYRGSNPFLKEKACCRPPRKARTRKASKRSISDIWCDIKKGHVLVKKGYPCPTSLERRIRYTGNKSDMKSALDKYNCCKPKIKRKKKKKINI